MTLASLLVGCEPTGEGRAYGSPQLDGVAGGSGSWSDLLPPPVPWKPMGELEVDDFGEAGWFSVPYPSGQRYIAVRTVPLDGEPGATERACHRVVEARLGSGKILLSPDEQPLGPNEQRFLPGPGAGVFVLSSVIEPLDLSDTLELRLALVDCAFGLPANRSRFTGLPHTVGVEAAWEAEVTEPSARALVAVRLLRAEDSGWGSVADDPELAEAWAVAVERFAAVEIELVLQAEFVGPATGVLQYAPDMQDFEALDSEVQSSLSTGPEDGRFVPVALVRCLETDSQSTRNRPLGQVTRLPGSVADPRAPSLVVVAAGACGSLEAEPRDDPTLHGIVLAHEIGHYLGLLHVDQEGGHLLADEDEQLMRSTIALDVDPEDAWFSAAQVSVMLRHPDVLYTWEQ